MTESKLTAGLIHQEKFTVESRHTVPQIDIGWPGFSDMPPVLATAMMIGFMEQTCIQALRPYLSEKEHTLGIEVAVSHVSPTLPGSVVTSTVELVAVDGRVLHFLVSCFDEKGLIGKGKHTRAIITLERFMKRLLENQHSD
ncbi:thioesterase family protein [Escherichia coli]